MGMRGAQAAVGGASQLTPLRRANMPAAVCPHSGITASINRAARIMAPGHARGVPRALRSAPRRSGRVLGALQSEPRPSASVLGALQSEPRPSGSVLGLAVSRSEEHTSELQSPCNLVCRLLLEKKKKRKEVRKTIQETLYTRTG